MPQVVSVSSPMFLAYDFANFTFFSNMESLGLSITCTNKRDSFLYLCVIGIFEKIEVRPFLYSRDHISVRIAIQSHSTFEAEFRKMS